MRADLEPIRETLREYMDKLDQLHERRGDIVGVATGFGDLDKLTGGLQKSDLIILAARPAVGKCLTAQTLIDDPLTGATTDHRGVRSPAPAASASTCLRTGGSRRRLSPTGLIAGYSQPFACAHIVAGQWR